MIYEPKRIFLFVFLGKNDNFINKEYRGPFQMCQLDHVCYHKKKQMEKILKAEKE